LSKQNRICNQCKKEVPSPDSKFCPFCGASLQNMSTEWAYEHMMGRLGDDPSFLTVVAKGLVLLPPKTDKSHRTIYIDEVIEPRLRAIWAKQQDEKLDAFRELKKTMGSASTKEINEFLTSTWHQPGRLRLHVREGAAHRSKQGNEGSSEDSGSYTPAPRIPPARLATHPRFTYD
jgi:endogenous inhibitor of DNA gyrase (YacG/DUF329 family)